MRLNESRGSGRTERWETCAGMSMFRPPGAAVSVSRAVCSPDVRDDKEA